MTKKVERVSVKTSSGNIINCNATVYGEDYCGYTLSGRLLGNTIFKVVETNDIVEIEGYGFFKVSKVSPTWLESGYVDLNLK